MSEVKKKYKLSGWIGVFFGVFVVLCLVVFFCFRMYLYTRYHTMANMTVEVKAFTPEEYPDNPAMLSQHYGEYSHPDVMIQRHKNNLFDLVFLPGNEKSAKIAFKNIDVNLMTPSLPSWVKNNNALTRIALTDRQWNRQQVIFNRDVINIEITGGDGVEKKQVYQAHLAKNCLNAGLWEVLLYSKEKHKKTLLYQGWFTFPVGHYKTMFTQNTGLSYWKHAAYLEHWITPESLQVDVGKLREVIDVYPLVLTHDTDEKIAVDGEQIYKKKNIISKKKLNQFKDYMQEDVSFATFSPPGIYQKNKPWKHEYWRINHPISAALHVIRSPAEKKHVLQELVITYADDKPNKNNDSYFYMSGFDINHLPRLDVKHYAKGQLFLMGIGTAPLKQSYVDLLKHPPAMSPVFSVFLNEKNEWINHHEAAIDGVILFIDKYKSNRLHMYLVSYERHAVVSHYTMTLPDAFLRRAHDS
ncbi:MAG: hypothetical protein K0U24_04230 [Gammaproteobacteria bacterium]|nr:hypothetical protein [Gammaproteobacteria bacterium]MCH9717925.1 hypothetical protein [Gammaproteobacteria bacterium]MCH9763422.1 hypothetical protein [Gammaproteobacteria bacterium]